MSGPANYCQEEIIQCYLASRRRKSQLIYINGDCVLDGTIDLKLLCKKLGLKYYSDHPKSLKDYFLEAFDKLSDATLMVVSIKGLEPNEQLKIAQNITLALGMCKDLKFIKIILNFNYLVNRYASVKDVSFSALPYFRPIDLVPLNEREISQLLVDCGIQYSKIKGLSVFILEFTSGHHGLVIECVRIILKNSAKSLRDVKELIVAHLKGCSILSQIKQRLSLNATDIISTALQYETPKEQLKENHSISYLIEIGVLAIVDKVLLKITSPLIKEVLHLLFAKEQELKSKKMKKRKSGLIMLNSSNYIVTNNDIVIVHISDIHMSDQFPFKIPENADKRDHRSLTSMLYKDLELLSLQSRVNGLVISGDFSEKGLPSEFDKAKTLIKDLMKRLSLKVNSVSLMPGNHDINWTKDSLSKEAENSTGTWDHYHRFLEMVGKKNIRKQDIIEIKSPSLKNVVRLIPIDSNDIEGPDASGIGFINPELFNTTADYLMKNKSAICHNWAITHHHVFPATSSKLMDAKRKKLSVLANASSLIHFSKMNNIEVILHGHEHQPFVNNARIWDTYEPNTIGSLVSIGAGSVSADKDMLGPFGKNHYYILIRTLDGLIIRSRSLGIEDDRFKPHADLFIPL
jgi:hypothetical protein